VKDEKQRDDINKSRIFLGSIYLYSEIFM